MENKEALKLILLQQKAIWWDMAMFFCWAIMFFVSKTPIQFLIGFLVILVLCQIFEWLEMKKIKRGYK